MDTIEYARAHGDLDQYASLRGIVLTYQGSILEYVYESEGLDPANLDVRPRQFWSTASRHVKTSASLCRSCLSSLTPGTFLSVFTGRRPVAPAPHLVPPVRARHARDLLRVRA
jgi:hypothetical protein